MLRRGAGQSVKPVDILREHRDKPLCLFKLNDGPVCRVGLCFRDVLPLTDLVVPVGDSGSLGSHEILVIDRLSTLGPDALWSAEIRDAAAGGNSGARENEYPVSGPEIIRQGAGVGDHR